MPKSERKPSGMSRTPHKHQGDVKSEDDADPDTDDGYDSPGEEDYTLRDITPAPTREQRADALGRRDHLKLTLAKRISYWPPKTRRPDQFLRWLFKFFRHMCHAIAPYAFNKYNVPYIEYKWVRLPTEVYLRTRSDPSIQPQNYPHTTTISGRHTSSSIKPKREILKQERSPDLHEVGEEAWMPGATSSILDCHKDLSRRIASCVESQVKAQVKRQLQTFPPLLQLSQLATQMSQLLPTTSPDPSGPYDSIIQGPEAGSKKQYLEEIDLSKIPEYCPPSSPPTESITSHSPSAGPSQLVSHKKKQKRRALDSETPSTASTLPPTDGVKKRKHRESTAAQNHTEEPPKEKPKAPSQDSPSTIPECQWSNSKGKDKIKRRSNGIQRDNHAAEQNEAQLPPAHPSRNAGDVDTELYNLYKGGFHEHSIYVTFCRPNAQRDTELNTKLGARLASWFPSSVVKGYSLFDRSYYYMVNFEPPFGLDRGIDLLERNPHPYPSGRNNCNAITFLPYQIDNPSHNPILYRARIKSIH